MAGSTLGKLFQITTFGESHGAGMGVIVQGVPPGLELDAGEIQFELDRRKPGARGDDPKRGLITPRAEQDEVEILSGVFESRTLGTPIALLIRNTDVDSSKYEKTRGRFRGSHADLAYLLKEGFYDWRGGGRASARETVARVAAGAIARKILAVRGINILAYVLQIGKVLAKKAHYRKVEVNAALHGIWCPDSEAAEKMAELVRTVMAEGDSVGAIIEVRAQGVPPGLGEPCFEKLDAALAAAMMSIPAVKGVEIGEGFALGSMLGSRAVDELFVRGDKIVSEPNHAGGILGGISTGNDIVARFVVKPTSSIRIPKRTVKLDWDRYEQNEGLHFADHEIVGGESPRDLAEAALRASSLPRPVTISTEGRHDPCVGIRAVPIAEAMMALTLCDFLMQQDAIEYWKERLSARRQQTQRHQNVLLVGARASGKSAIGQMLAERLAWPFVEMDQLLSQEMEEEGHRLIATFVETKGWKEFRRRERRLLKQLGRKNRQVIACGGGICGDHETAELAKRAGVVVWLDAPAEILFERRRQDAEEHKRPALIEELAELKLNDFERYLRIEVNSIAAQRRPFYSRSDLRMDATWLPEGVAQEIEERLRRFGIAAPVSQLDESEDESEREASASEDVYKESLPRDKLDTNTDREGDPKDSDESVVISDSIRKTPAEPP